MPNLKEVRNRITSVHSTKQITSAMKMVSAAKLRRAQDAITRMRPYADRLRDILSNVSASLDPSEGKYAQQREVKRVLLVAITSNRGLAGAFNAQVIRMASATASELQSAEVKVLSIGKKANDFFKKTPLLDDDLPDDLAKLFDDLTFNNVAPIAEMIMEKFAEENFDEVHLIYNRFKNAAVYVATKEQFLPILPPDTTESTGGSKGEHIMEPSREVIVQEIIPKSLKIQLYKAMLDSHAAEHGARMTAMHKATDNAEELLKELRLTYNKARQAAITNEILEIVGGAEALEN